MKDLKNYSPGRECKCGAYYSAECACIVDWTPKQVYELKNLLEEVIIYAKTGGKFPQHLLEKIRESGIDI